MLVVTNDPVVADEARLGFPSDFYVEVAHDARQAMDVLSRLTPAVMIVDLQSGSAGGFALLKDMSQIARLARVPVLMLVRRWQDAWLAEQAGAARVCRKPIATGDLVREVLELRDKQPA